MEADPSGFPPEEERSMVETGIELHEGLARSELEDLARADPVPHAFAFYDMERFPEKVRFVTLRDRGRTIAYLLIWYGDPSVPVVHWFGGQGTELLSKGLPSPPYVAVVPPEVSSSVRWSPPGSVSPIELWVRRRALPPPELTALPSGVGIVRRLTPSDQGLVGRFADRHRDSAALSALGGLDLSRVRLYGGIRERDGEARLVSTARTIAEAPGVWVLGGVYTEPSERGKGWARAVAWSTAREAHEAGSDCALYVRSDNAPARSAYSALGFHPAFLLSWVDAGGGPPP